MKLSIKTVVMILITLSAIGFQGGINAAPGFSKCESINISFNLEKVTAKEKELLKFVADKKATTGYKNLDRLFSNSTATGEINKVLNPINNIVNAGGKWGMAVSVCAYLAKNPTTALTIGSNFVSNLGEGVNKATNTTAEKTIKNILADIIKLLCKVYPHITADNNKDLTQKLIVIIQKGSDFAKNLGLCKQIKTEEVKIDNELARIKNLCTHLSYLCLNVAQNRQDPKDFMALLYLLCLQADATIGLQDEKKQPLIDQEKKERITTLCSELLEGNLLDTDDKKIVQFLISNSDVKSFYDSCNKKRAEEKQKEETRQREQKIKQEEEKRKIEEQTANFKQSNERKLEKLFPQKPEQQQHDQSSKSKLEEFIKNSDQNNKEFQELFLKKLTENKNESTQEKQDLENKIADLYEEIKKLNEKLEKGTEEDLTQSEQSGYSVKKIAAYVFAAACIGSGVYYWYGVPSLTLPFFLSGRPTATSPITAPKIATSLFAGALKNKVFAPCY